VQLLEDELGVRLLDRTSTGVQMTTAGELLLGFARRSSRLSQQVLAGLAQLEGQPGGALRLAASTTVAQYLLPRMLGAFRKENQRIALTVRSGNTEQVTAWVLQGEAQLGMVEGPPASKEVAIEHFLEDKLTMIVPRDHRWAGKEIPPARLTQVPFLLREAGSGTRRVIERALRKAGVRLSQLNIAMELDSTEAIVSGVEAGLGVGIVSELALRKALRLGTVATVKIEGLEMRRPFSLIRLRGPVEAGPVAAFRNFAMSHDRD